MNYDSLFSVSKSKTLKCMISKSISRQVLTVGENYKIPRGGISSVINTYSRYFSEFKFVATYNPWINKWKNIVYYLKGVVALANKLFLDRNIKIVHIHGCHNGSFYRKLGVMLLAKFFFGKKLIYHSHSSGFHIFYNNSNYFSKNLIRFFLTRMDLIICLSRQWKVFFEENFDPEKIIILENIVEPVKTLNKNRSSNYLKLLFLGEIGERKGIFDLLEVLNENKRFFEDKVHLNIGGNGDVKRLLKFIEKNDLQSLVSYKGWIAGENKQLLLSNSDIFILPSYNEGLPISILEAMSYKIPVIATDVGGISEVVHHEVNGFLITPGDKVSLYNYLKKFIENPFLIEEMGNQSELIISPYYPNSVISKLENIYKEILECN